MTRLHEYDEGDKAFNYQLKWRLKMKQWRSEEELEDYIRYVKDYFGEWIKSGEKFVELAEAVNYDGSFKGMDGIRNILRAEGYDVPFVTSYRRRKK